MNLEGCFLPRKVRSGSWCAFQGALYPITTSCCPLPYFWYWLHPSHPACHSYWDSEPLNANHWTYVNMAMIFMVFVMSQLCTWEGLWCQVIWWGQLELILWCVVHPALHPGVLFPQFLCNLCFWNSMSSWRCHFFYFLSGSVWFRRGPPALSDCWWYIPLCHSFDWLTDTLGGKLFLLASKF